MSGLVLLGGCAGQFSHGVYSEGAVRYRVGELPGSWQRVALRGNDLAFLSLDSPHSLAVNATCQGHDDPPLDVLTRHLLMGFTERETVSQQLITLDGREGLRSHVTAKLDGVPVEMVMLVMKKQGCVYDFTYLSPRGQLAARLDAFEQLVAQFHTEKAS